MDEVRNQNLQQEPETVQQAEIWKARIMEATRILEKYKQGKKNLETRLIENEEYWKLNHWAQFEAKTMNKNDPRPTSAWLFNSINNKHADAMDNYPEPNVLPREESDKSTASKLSDIIPVVLENNEFEATYSDAWWDKLKGGTAAYGVFWNKTLLNGLGDVDVKVLDLLNIFWEPGIQDIQKSRNLFIVELMDQDVLMEQYPQYKGEKNGNFQISEYHYDDTVDTTDKVAVVDWYYKKGGLLHYVKYVNDTVLYASENDPACAERGFYDDGDYPVIFDVLFREKGTPAGFGYIDIMRDPQMYIDKMDSAFLKSAVNLSKPRWWVKDSGNVNEEEYADMSREFVHVAGSLDDTGIRQIETREIPQTYLKIKTDKVDELKETSGNRDFSQGTTTSGVTAASAIAALQEAGSKTSRDMIKSSYRTFKQICYLVIERIRQFYDAPRCFRIDGPNNQQQFVTFDNDALQMQGDGMEFGVEITGRMPVFDIMVRPQKASPFSKIAQNELAKELYGMGVFNPEYADQAYTCIDMMDFEGKDTVMQRIQENGMMYQQIQQLQASMAQMAQLIADSTGDTRILDALGAQGIQAAQATPQMPEENTDTLESNAIGEVTKKAENSQAGKARTKAAQIASPKV